MPKDDYSSGMSWESMWTYFKSSLCSDEQRRFTLNSFNLRDSIEAATSRVQIEILEYAPEYILNDPEILEVLGLEAKRTLIKTTVQVMRPMSAEEVERIKNQISMKWSTGK